MTANTCYLEPYRIIDAQRRVEIFRYFKIHKKLNFFDQYFSSKSCAPHFEARGSRGTAVPFSANFGKSEHLLSIVQQELISIEPKKIDHFCRQIFVRARRS